MWEYQQAKVSLRKTKSVTTGILIPQCSLSILSSVPSVCSRIGSTLSECTNFYAHSIFPNNVTRSESEAEQRYGIYRRFFENLDCSKYAQIYICLALAPYCDPSLPRPRPPCASFCDNVKAQCNDEIIERGGYVFDVLCLLECPRQVEFFAACPVSNFKPPLFKHTPARHTRHLYSRLCLLLDRRTCMSA